MPKHLVNYTRNGSRLIKGIPQSPLMNILNYKNIAPQSKIVDIVKLSLAIDERLQIHDTKTYLCNKQRFLAVKLENKNCIGSDVAQHHLYAWSYMNLSVAYQVLAKVTLHKYVSI